MPETCTSGSEAGDRNTHDRKDAGRPVPDPTVMQPGTEPNNRGDAKPLIHHIPGRDHNVLP